MTQEDKDLLLKDLCARLPYGVKLQSYNYEDDIETVETLYNIDSDGYMSTLECDTLKNITKPYLFPISSMTEEDYATYFKIWEDTGKMAYLDGCHHLITNIKAYKAANDYLLSKHYDINRLIPMGLAIDATGLNIY